MGLRFINFHLSSLLMMWLQKLTIFSYFFLEVVGGVIGYGGELVVADELMCLSEMFVSVQN